MIILSYVRCAELNASIAFVRRSQERGGIHGYRDKSQRPPHVTRSGRPKSAYLEEIKTRIERIGMQAVTVSVCTMCMLLLAAEYLKTLVSYRICTTLQGMPHHASRNVVLSIFASMNIVCVAGGGIAPCTSLQQSLQTFTGYVLS